MLFLLSLGHCLDLLMIYSLVGFQESLLLFFDPLRLEIFDDGFHLRNWVAFGGQDEPLMPLIFALAHILRNLVAELLVVYLTLALQSLSIEVLVEIKSAERHVIPEFRILAHDSKRHLLEALECLIVLAALEQRRSV